MAYVLVTGATGGLGKEFCNQLCKANDLFLTGRSEEKLKALSEELGKLTDRKIEYGAMNLIDEDDRKRFFKDIDDRGIKFSGLVNVAGVDTQKEFMKYTEEKIVFQVRVNFEATLSITRSVLERRDDSRFQLLTVSSMSGTTYMPYFAIYSATKGALISFFTSLRYEVPNANITILAPGGIPTRPDIIRDIEIQGATGRLSAKPAAFVVEKALKGLRRNKRMVIPGFFNKLVYFFERITPKSIQCRYVAKHWKNKEKDAF